MGAFCNGRGGRSKGTKKISSNLWDVTGGE